MGYVVKMYPRLSETFILNEILALERQGQPLHIFSLRPPIDGRFHAELAQVRAPVVYLPDGATKGRVVWEALAAAGARFPDVFRLMPQLTAVPVDDAVQGLALAHEVADRGITHLHAHFATSPATGARLASLITGVPFTFTAHAKDIFHRDVDPDDLRRKLHDAAAVVTVSDFNLAYLRREFGSDATGVRRIYNGLDLRRHEFSEPSGRPAVIAAVGRLVEKKGFADLIDACALLAKRDVDLRCVIVGGGDEEEALRTRIRRHNLQGQVQLAGRLPQGAVQDMIRAAAVFAAPCLVGRDGNRDGLPTVLLEAMAVGTPCVATDVTGIPEVVRDRETGLLVPQRDPHALAEALLELLEDEALRVRLALAARRLVETHFDVDRQAEHLRDLFVGQAPLTAVV